MLDTNKILNIKNKNKIFLINFRPKFLIAYEIIGTNLIFMV